MPRPSPSPFPTNRPNFFVEPSTTIESLRNSSTRCEPLASRCSSTPSKDPLVEKEKYHPKCALTSRHSDQHSRILGEPLLNVAPLLHAHRTVEANHLDAAQPQKLREHLLCRHEFREDQHLYVWITFLLLKLVNPIQ